MNYNLKTLEFETILNILKKFCQIDETKVEVFNIKPYNDIFKISTLLDEVKIAFVSLNKYSDIPLKNFPTVKNAISRSKIDGVLNEPELLEIASLIVTTANVLKYFKELNNISVNTDLLNSYLDSLTVLKELQTEILDSIDETGTVLSSASVELSDIRKKLSGSEAKLRSKMNELLNSRSKMLNESLIVIRNQRMCLPVKAEFKNTFKGIIHDESASQTTFYIEPSECVEINIQISKLVYDEKQELLRILKKISKSVKVYHEKLLTNYNTLKILDLIYAKAKYAKEYDYNCPNINDQKIINLKKAKHPLISEDKIVPIDVSLGSDYNVIIITGPNTGGKTVALKTVGLLTCMTQAGLFIPCCETSTLSIFDNIFVDIGDEQSIEMSLSTFSSHMTKIISIVDNITPSSLVLLDELGSGTDPKEGSSLAINIIEYLKNKDARVIVTTHYSDLKAYALANNDIISASVEFDITTLKPTYKLLMGVGGKSNAIMIARRLGLNDIIINKSLEAIKSNNSQMENLIDKIDEQHHKIRHIEDELNHKIKKYDTLILETNTLKEDLLNKELSYLKEAKAKADEIVLKAKEDASKLINDLSNMQNKAFKEHELADLKYQAKNLNTKDIVNVDNDHHVYKVGDMVYIKKYDKHSTITKIKKDQYEINIGNFAMLFTKDELLPSTYKEPVITKPKYKKITSTNKVSGDMSFSLDLRGFRYDEVSHEIDKFIDNAYLKNIDIISIIHGHGTGTIRKAVWEYLKTSSYVKSYRYGVEGEGLNGATIVTLK